MIRDVRTIIWKEIKEILGRRGLLKGGKAGIFIMLACFGVFMPLQFGRQWLASPMAMVYWAWVPFLLVSGVVADSFAGERERHTLETLLASRLPDRAILAGKIGAALVYGWGLTLGCVLLGAAAMTIVHGRGKVIFYSGPCGFGHRRIHLPHRSALLGIGGPGLSPGGNGAPGPAGLQRRLLHSFHAPLYAPPAAGVAEGPARPRPEVSIPSRSHSPSPSFSPSWTPRSCSWRTRVSGETG